jgi:hypothetical protein
MGPSQYALFHVDAKTGHHRNAYGRRLASHWSATCLLFDSLEEAKSYAAKKVAEMPSLACKIYDRTEGADAAETTVNEAFGRKPTRQEFRRGLLVGLAWIAASFVAFWYVWRSGWTAILVGLVGVRLLQVGLGRIVKIVSARYES